MPQNAVEVEILFSSIRRMYVLNFIFLLCSEAETQPPPPLWLYNHFPYVAKSLKLNIVHNLCIWVYDKHIYTDFYLPTMFQSWDMDPHFKY